MSYYRAFGMRINSTVELGLPLCEADIESDWPVSIGFGSLDPCPILSESIGTIRYGKIPGGIRIEVPRTGRFHIRGDSSIVVDPDPGADMRVVGLYITGLVMPCLLRFRPFITLHGSAVVAARADSKVIAFVGDQGSGKSTTAAALARRGWSVLCDDIIPIGPGPLVHPGVARPKLLPDAYRNLVGDPDDAFHLFDGVDKYQVDLGAYHSPAPLSAIFVLEAGDIDRLRIGPIKGMAKISTLYRHISSIRGIDDPVKQFTRFTERLGSVPAFRVDRPRAGDCLSALVDILIDYDEKQELP